MKIHELKTDPDVFQQVWEGQKTFEIRKNDRNFQVGDMLVLRETEFSGKQMTEGMTLEYTGLQVVAIAISLMCGPIYGLCEDWCIMSIKPIWRSDHLCA